MDDQKPKRPTLRDAAVLDRAVEVMWPRVQAWDGHDPNRDEKSALRKALRWNTDGFKIARDLDAWCPDAALVEILDSAGEELRFAVREEAKAWVAANGLATPICIGARVAFERGGNRITGTVTVRDAASAEYLVFCESLGHVRGRHVGTTVAAEDVEAIET